jgi:hypothetical protein
MALVHNTRGARTECVIVMPDMLYFKLFHLPTACIGSSQKRQSTCVELSPNVMAEFDEIF